MIVALRAPSLAKFGEVDTVPVSENSFNIAKVCARFQPIGRANLLCFQPIGWRFKIYENL